MKTAAKQEEAAFRTQLASSSKPPTLAQARKLVELQARASNIPTQAVRSGAQLIANHLERITPMSEADAKKRQPIAIMRTAGARPNYEHVHASEVPGAVRFDVPAEFEGNDIEVAYGGDPRAEKPHDMGAPFKRVRNLVTKKPATFFRREGVVKDDAAAWKATKVADGKRSLQIDSGEYERNHGAKPRGRGSWMFIFADSHEQLQAKEHSPNYLEHVWTARAPDGSSALLFGEAVKLAKAEARKRAACWIGVCS